MATKNQTHDLTEEWWDILIISPDASVRDIHQAYERLRMSHLPMNRDRSIPISAEATEQLQKLDRAFRMGLDSKKPSVTLGKQAASKTSAKAPTKTSKKTAPPAQPSGKDPFHSVVQEWAKTSSQSPLPTATDSTANAPAGDWPHTNVDTQNTQPSEKKSATGDKKTTKKSGGGSWWLFIIVVCGIGGYLMGSDTTPASSNTNRNSGSAPPPRAAPSQAPTPQPQYNPSAPVADALVVALQQELNRRGFNAGVVDGLIGPQTSSAISAAQSSFNMYIDGKPSEALLRALRRH
jgi:hypothetical protein